MDAGAAPTVHRLRDLDRRGRVWAGAFALALLLAPALAFAWAAPRWTPANDPALMALRALDVGTSRTPLTGQPSTSAHYVAADRHVDHPGPLHFYLMAVPVRVLGPALGMLAVSLVITGGSVLLAAWAFFRQLGPAAGAVAAVALGAVTFTTGAAALVNPVSSNMAGYPMLCSVVLLWCLACGDLRLLPLATAVVSFTAQQHLSVLAALGVATVGGVAIGAVAWGRAGRWRDPDTRRHLWGWVGLSAVVALVLWTPVLVEQAAPRGGNLTAMVEFAADGGRPTLGPDSAVRQVVNVLGLPPLLGQTQATGGWLIARPAPLTWASAAVVVAALAVLAFRWRRSAPKRLALVAMAGVVALAGLVNGASVPEGLEKYRLALYHWAFPLALLVVVALALGLAEQVARYPLARSDRLRPALAGWAVAAIAVPALVNPSLDRPSNTLAAAYSPVDRQAVERVADEVAARRDDLGGDVVLVGRGGTAFDGIPEAVGLMLVERGISVRFTSRYLYYVDDERLADPDTAETGLLVVIDDSAGEVQTAGELVASTAVEGFDDEAYRALRAEADAADGVRFGPAVEQALSPLPADLLADVESGGLGASVELWRLLDELPAEAGEALVTALSLAALPDQPSPRLLDRRILDFLIEHPLEQPRLDPGLLRRLRDSLPDPWDGGPLSIEVRLLDRHELLAATSGGELG